MQIETETVPCSRVLRDVILNLDTVFGTAVGAIAVDTAIAPVALPAYKRRALVLAATQLVVGALLRVSLVRQSGRIGASLRSVGNTHALLRVTHDGTGDPSRQAGITSGLADLLEGGMAYNCADGLTTTVIAFPL